MTVDSGDVDILGFDELMAGAPQINAHLVVVAGVGGRGEEFGGIGVVDVDEVVPLVVGVGVGGVLDGDLGGGADDVAVEGPEGGGGGLEGAPVEGPGWAVLELPRQDEGHVGDFDVVDVGGRQQESVEHALLVDGTGSLHEGFGPKTDDIEVGQEILNNGESAVGSGDSVVPGSGGGVGVALSIPVVAEVGLAVGDGVSQV